MLKRFLLLALLLDQVMTNTAPRPKGTPLLFRRGQPIKSSVQVGTLVPARAHQLQPCQKRRAVTRHACMLVPSTLSGTPLTCLQHQPQESCSRQSAGYGRVGPGREGVLLR